MTPFKIAKKKLTHNEINVESCHWCYTKNGIEFYCFENTLNKEYAGIVWSCARCLEGHPPREQEDIIIHKMSTQDIFTLKLLFPNA